LTQKIPRPKQTVGGATRRRTGCGNIYVVLGNNASTGQLIEVFANLGKAGGCSQCQNEALSRSISLGLKYGVPASEYVDQLLDIRCPNPAMFPHEEKSLSCADAIAQVLQEYLSANTHDVQGNGHKPEVPEVR
jgi:ribonucleoside-diphosphate reductase alpha chain